MKLEAEKYLCISRKALSDAVNVKGSCGLTMKEDGNECRMWRKFTFLQIQMHMP